MTRLKTIDMVTLYPYLCVGKVCTGVIRTEICLGDWRGRESTLESISDSQLLFLGATLARAGPAHFILASFSL